MLRAAVVFVRATGRFACAYALVRVRCHFFIARLQNSYAAFWFFNPRDEASREVIQQRPLEVNRAPSVVLKLQITYPGDGNYSAFTYDALDRNVEIQEYSDSSLSSTKQFVWCDRDRCESRDDLGVTLAQYFTNGETISGSKYFYAEDHLGSVRELTDNSGIVQSEQTYDPFGRSAVLKRIGSAGLWLYETLSACSKRAQSDSI